MACTICPIFLQDFLQTGIPEKIALSKLIRKKSLSTIAQPFAEWIHRLFHKIAAADITKASKTAHQISKRGRSDIEYEFVLCCATFNLLKFEVPWLQEEETYIAIPLIESGLLKGRNAYRLMSSAKEYIGYITIRAFYFLREIHDDHVNPKGLMTNLNTTVQYRKSIEKDETLYDRDDDYQKDILEEVDLSDLYS